MAGRDSKLDDRGRERVLCKQCELEGRTAYYHRLENHVSVMHVIGIEDYEDRFPGEPIMSMAARSITKKGGAKRKQQAPKRPVHPVVKTTDESGAPVYTFGCAKLVGRTELSEVDAQLVPVHDEQWSVGASELGGLEVLAVAMETNQNVLIVGPPGVGKSTLAKELASITNSPMAYFPVHGEVRVDDWMGVDQLVKDEESGQTITRSVDGPLPVAAERGYWTLFDEFDSIPSQAGFILHGVLEESRRLTRANGKPVCFHEQFRFIATCNTLGLGDETGQFAGTAPMNWALLDRFGIVIRVGYPAVNDEIAMLTAKGGIDSGMAAKMVDVAKRIREAAESDTVGADLSPRRLLMWASAYRKMRDIGKAAKFTVVNRMSREDADFVSGVIQRVFGISVK